jgi:hypothetical protein
MRSVVISSSVDAREGCEVDFEIAGSGMVWAYLGSDREGFDLSMHPEVLREFLRQGEKVLREMDEMHAREELERASCVPS